MTSVLTDEEIDAIEEETTGNAIHKMDSVPFARAIEVAVIRKLSTKINVEPVMAYECDGASVMYAPMNHPDQLPIGKHTLFTLDQLAIAIAAERVQENERCAAWLDSEGDEVVGQDLNPYKLAEGIRALLGKEAT